MSRPIRIIIDARLTGHEFHEELNYPIPYPLIGDCLDRYIPRINEIIESCRIIYALLYLIVNNIKGSIHNSTTIDFASQSWIFSSTTMELVISEFLISHQLILSFIHQSKLSIESSKGIYSIHLFPYFHHITTCIITSDFPTTNQLNKFSKNTNLGDIIAVLGSIDFVLGSVDG